MLFALINFLLWCGIFINFKYFTHTNIDWFVYMGKIIVIFYKFATKKKVVKLLNYQMRDR